MMGKRFAERTKPAGSGSDGLDFRFGGQKGYFSDELMDVKLALRVVPNPFTAAMIASAIPAAIRPYSIAVAPD